MTNKECDRNFPEWTAEHTEAFEAIKRLVVSRESLTVIDHDVPGENKIFVTTDASDFRTGAVLSWGKTWETARLVAFNSVQLNEAQKRYPVHEKELLAIVRALKKWKADLLGEQIWVYTDHKTLEIFETQKELSQRQAHWQEDMAQFDMTIVYIKGKDNTIADALLRMPISEPVEPKQCPMYKVWLRGMAGAVLTVNAARRRMAYRWKSYLTVINYSCRSFGGPYTN
jgi:hypothetical protein